MKALFTFITLCLGLHSLAQTMPWQAQYDSAFYYNNVGFLKRAKYLAEQLEEGKQISEDFKKYQLLAQINSSLYNDKDALINYKKCIDLIVSKKIKIKKTEFEDLQFELYDVYLNMNDLESADSLLKLFESRKSFTDDYYYNKYWLLKKLGRDDEAEEFREFDISSSSDLLAKSILIEDHIENNNFEEANYEIDYFLINNNTADLAYPYFYLSKVQCSENLGTLKTILKKLPGSWKNDPQKELETLLVAMNVGYRLNEYQYSDSLAQVIINQSKAQLGLNNYFHLTALSELFKQTIIRNELIKSRNLSIQLEELLKTCIGENTVVYTVYAYYVQRYKEMLGYKEEVKSTVERYIKLIDEKASKKFSYFTAYSTWYFDLDPTSPKSNEYLIQANQQYKQDDNNCNGCYSLLLTSLAKSKEAKKEYAEAEKLFRLAWEKSKTNMSNEILYRTDLTDFYRRCHALGVRSQLEYFPEVIQTLKNDTLRSTYKNLKYGMWYLSDLMKNYDDALAETTNYRTTGLLFNKTKLAWIDDDETTTLTGFREIFDETLHQSELLDYMSEKEKLPFYQNIINPIQAYYAFAIPRSSLYKSYLIERKYANHIKGLQKNYDSYIIKEEQYRGKDYYHVTPLFAKNAFNIRLATKGLLFSSQKNLANRILESGDTTLIHLLHQVEELKKELASVYVSSKQKAADKEEKIEMLTEKISELEIVLGEKSVIYKQQKNTSINFEQIQKSLQPNEAVVEVIRFHHPLYYLTDQTHYRDSIYYAFLVVTSLTLNQPQVILFKNGYDLENKYYKYYKNAMLYRQDDNQSYNVFYKELNKHLYGSKVYLSPDGVYNLINLRSLKNPRTGEYLIQEADITLVSDLKEVADRNTTTLKEKPTALLIGDPAFSADTLRNTENKRSFELSDLFEGGISRLVGTKAETININNMLKMRDWKTEIHNGVNASEESVKAAKHPTVLHLATHGFFYNGEENKKTNPLLLSGLLFAGVENNDLKTTTEDGVLTAYEAQSLALNKTELVVLSACETGSGIVSAGDGVYGLQRAFKTAGCKSLIMSLWSVDDEATSLLMQSFYKNWIGGQSKNEALKNAQYEVMKKYPHPFYWAAFVMVGE